MEPNSQGAPEPVSSERRSPGLGAHPRTRPKPKPQRQKQPANPLVKGILAFCTHHGIDIVGARQSKDAGTMPNVPVVSGNSDVRGEVGRKNTGESRLPDQGLRTKEKLEAEAEGDAHGLRTKGNYEAQAEDEPPTQPRLAARQLLPLSAIPRRYTVYASLVLLPSNFTTQNPRWTEVYNGFSETERSDLFRAIAEQGFGIEGIRIAISAPIAAEEEEDAHDQEQASMAGPRLPEDLSTTSTSISTQALPRKQNILRSPSGLVPVHGDWGFSLPRARGGEDTALGARSDRYCKTTIIKPSRRDFDEAFWTSASQHKGITQCWAPLYTMFSRGNVSEKARILGLASSAPFSQKNDSQDPSRSESEELSKASQTTLPRVTAQSPSQAQFPGLTPAELGEPLSSIDVVDFYVGIGYFAFCYLSRGVRRVWGWDINPWSIEGLRRGCEKNGWDCLAVRVDEEGQLALIESKMTSEMKDSVHRADVVKEIVARIRRGDSTASSSPAGREGQQAEVRCVAFLGDNKCSDSVMAEIQGELSRHGLGLNVRHANLGLLPTSRGSWENAVKAIKRQNRKTDGSRGDACGGWLHVHENVDVRHIEAVRDQIVQELHVFAQHQSGKGGDGSEPTRWSVLCDHIHQVKTYAPGVMHCVFDIHITPNG